MTKKQYLTAKEAAAELNISVKSLYVYVSQGLIRSEPLDNKKRMRRYHWEDIAHLKERQALRRNPRKTAENALHWGMPLMESGISLIQDGRLYYRGYDVEMLINHHRFEDVATLIWLDELLVPNFDLWADHRDLLPTLKKAAKNLPDLTPIERFQIALPIMANRDLASYDFSPETIVATGIKILSMFAVAVNDFRPSINILSSLTSAWHLDNATAEDLLNTALILCADHELNVSAFTARCVTSANATPYQVVNAGLSALQGVKHGGNVNRVLAFMNEARNGIHETIRDRIKRGEGLSGFGHKLYPNGDIRATLLLEKIREHYPYHEAVQFAQEVLEITYQLTEEQPNIDFALAVLVEILELPRSAAIAIFALGRTVGWIGHAIEQYELNQIIRPRARYCGRQPQEDS